MMLRKLDVYMVKSETRSLAPTVCKNDLKQIKDLNLRTKTIKLLDDSIGDFFITFFRPHIFLNKISKTQTTKAKKNRITHQTKSLQSKRNKERKHLNFKYGKGLIDRLYKKLKLTQQLEKQHYFYRNEQGSQIDMPLNYNIQMVNGHIRTMFNIINHQGNEDQ